MKKANPSAFLPECDGVTSKKSTASGDQRVKPTRRQILGNARLKKGGVHRKTGKALRRGDKINLRRKWPLESDRMTIFLQWSLAL